MLSLLSSPGSLQKKTWKLENSIYHISTLCNVEITGISPKRTQYEEFGTNIAKRIELSLAKLLRFAGKLSWQGN